mmetsp:Transcript_9283/g.13944  ORF Transcript_9283/g.13944 Transcript_9283/m.13944 type:complete len:318 (-) Transcript_9283:138-1091(-)|eukprot:CAMPEP_0171462282 /NCGR_PEP_ID=MMETSP0945-20130129/6379_1 /TAXON_ID=109269 /ORGANISM="Vaucheria litorea, Strain CCMP2940" /LENGTH=317 /DNA_ID=CAMNT_0011988771 /DNA_START=143 /DNA_END=1096 /DNA_ORIENTATION=-
MATNYNPYALLESDEEDRPIKVKAPKKPKQKKPKPAEIVKPAPEPAPLPSTAPETAPVKANPNKESTPRKVRIDEKVEKSDDKVTEDTFEAPSVSKENVHDKKTSGARKQGGIKSRDKQSGGSKMHGAKKQGAGDHNWGSTEGEIAAALAEADISEEPDTSKDEPVEEKVPVVEKKKEVQTITYKEFQEKLNAERIASLEKFGPLKAKEVDISEFASGKIRKKNSKTKEAFVPPTANKTETKKPAKGKEKKIFTEVGFTMPPIENQGRGGGRGRGRDANFGGRGGQHSTSKSSNLSTSIEFNEASFPKLKEAKGMAA